jgi:hypothetical protein
VPVNRLFALPLLTFTLGACSKPIVVVVRDGPNVPCEAAIPEGPTVTDMRTLQTTLASAGNREVVVHANRGTSKGCVASAKDAALRAGKRAVVKIDAD